MSPDDAEIVDDELADLLAQCDSHLAAGKAVDGPEPRLSHEQLQLYRLARSSILRLERQWPRQQTLPSSGPKPREGVPSDLGEFGKYRIHDELGRGASSVVLLATDIQTGQIVALKLPRLEAFFDVDLRSRFRREADLVTRLDHDGLVPVHDAGECNGVYYIASKYTHEITLESFIEDQREPIPIRMCAAIVVSLSQAVDYLHRQRVIHRDIKPSNILLSPNSQGETPPDLANAGRPRLTDFGLAKLLEVASSDVLENQTLECQLLGTSEFMSPEQAHGQLGEVTESTDIYSLGAVLYTLLGGQPPIRGRNRFDTMQLLRSQEPLPLRELRRDVPRDLEAVCLQCLEKDPRRRYPTAAALAEDLQRYLDGLPTIAQPMPWRRRAVRWLRQHPKVARTGAWTLIAVLFVVAMTYLLRRGADWAQTNEIRKGLFATELNSLPPLVAHLRARLPQVESDFRQVAAHDPSIHRRLRAHLVLAQSDDASAEWLWRHSLVASPAELQLICAGLQHQPKLWAERWNGIWQDTASPRSQKLRAASCLAQLDTNDRSDAARQQIVELVTEEAETSSIGWTQLLEPIQNQLIPHLKSTYLNPAKTNAVRNVAAAALANYCGADLSLIVQLLADAEVEQFETLLAPLRAQSATAIATIETMLDSVTSGDAAGVSPDQWARQQANLAIALWQLGKPNAGLSRLAHGRDSRTQYQLLFRLAPTRVDPSTITNALKSVGSDEGHFALLLALGDYRKDSIPANIRAEVSQRVAETFRHHPDASVHSAAQHLLCRWGFHLPPIRRTLEDAIAQGHRWYCTTQGQTLALIAPGLRPGLGHFQPFAIGTTEITIAQFQEFRPTHNCDPKLFTSAQCPVTDVTFIAAAEYCNWLSAQDGLPESKFCYVITNQDKNTPSIEFHPERPGYRLPTEAEREIAARCGAPSTWFFGDSDEILSNFAWHYRNSDARPSPVGRLAPNPLGLFDIHGNVTEWMQGSRNDAFLQSEVIGDGSWRQLPEVLRPGRERVVTVRTYHDSRIGFRIARSFDH